MKETIPSNLTEKVTDISSIIFQQNIEKPKLRLILIVIHLCKDFYYETLRSLVLNSRGK